MRSCKRLKNINSVSGKLGERHVDPLLPVANASFGEAYPISEVWPVRIETRQSTARARVLQSPSRNPRDRPPLPSSSAPKRLRSQEALSRHGALATTSF